MFSYISLFCQGLNQHWKTFYSAGPRGQLVEPNQHSRRDQINKVVARLDLIPGNRPTNLSKQEMQQKIDRSLKSCLHERIVKLHTKEKTTRVFVAGKLFQPSLNVYE